MAATRAELLAKLDSLEIATQTRDHAAVFTVEEARHLRGEIPGGHCKNLFLKDKKDQLWLVVCLEDARIDLKTLPDKIGAARISFGKPELLMEFLGVEPGSVTPFAVINDHQARVKVILDAAMMREPLLNYHPLENTATTSIAARDLVRFLTALNHAPQIIAVS
ncbi:MAG: prolyl-tRNA synthetase associated domain-containing protein [Aestuariivirgaceae bacterium]|nr:prolyl-tRNA synthetase associated domain-containing protein [Aestuariivirgaceae bacterium]